MHGHKSWLIGESAMRRLRVCSNLRFVTYAGSFNALRCTIGFRQHSPERVAAMKFGNLARLPTHLRARFLNLVQIPGVLKTLRDMDIDVIDWVRASAYMYTLSFQNTSQGPGHIGL